MYAGSVYDGIKISKMDEYDMDIVIRLPINYDKGIIIENEEPGYVKLKITKAFDNLPNENDWENYHRVTLNWRDEENYFLQNRFRQWMHGVVQTALYVMGGEVTVNGVRYLLTCSENGPAYTLNIRNNIGEEEFKLDVDLVPVIKFMFPREVEGYKTIAGYKSKNWLVVPKPQKEMPDSALKKRCWRLSFHEQEREIIKGCDSLKMTVRLLKKLRDVLQMKKITSYHIKTLFLWQADDMKTDKTYWQNDISFLFSKMVEKLQSAIHQKNIPYFWNSNYNLLKYLKPTLLQVYSDNLNKVVVSIKTNNHDKLLTYLLTDVELREFNETKCPKEKRISELETKISDLVERLKSAEYRLTCLEREVLELKQQQTFTRTENLMLPN